MTLLPVDELLTPVSESEPCGADLTYAPEFAELETAALGKPERQTGDVLVAAEPPVWPEVYDAALALARRTRDLRVAVLLARAGARTRGLAGYASGLSLIARLLEQQWDAVHPQLDASDNNDPTMRLNALASLCSPAGLSDLRSAGVVGVGHPMTARLIELAWTKAEAMPGESRPTTAALVDGLQKAAAGDGAIYERMRAAHEAASSIERTISQRVGIAGPDFKPLLQITQALSHAVAAATGQASAMPQAGAASVGHGMAVAAPGAIGSREDVVRTLGAVCDWIERHEPSNPAPLLIRRAQRLMSKSFIDLVRDLAPDGLTQLERIAGAAES
jgi:type VI secretion system protein ImpA